MEDILEEAVPVGSTMPHGPDWKGEPRQNTVTPQVTKINTRTTYLDKLGRQHRATKKQVKLIEFMLQGYSRRQAALKAGYSLNVANTSTNLFNKSGMKQMMASLADEFEKVGLNKGFWAKKIAEWAGAQKVVLSHTGPDREFPDYDTQLKAYDRWKAVDDQANNIQGDSKGLKRKVTFEEFIDE